MSAVKSVNKPLVSVLISCYNYAEFVDQSLKSALSQTYDNVEIIVINDGSTDNSHEVVSNLKKQYDFQYINQKNRGVIATIERSLGHLGGDYFIHLAADDIMPDNYISELVDTAQKTNASIVYTDLVNLDTGELVMKPPAFDIELIKHFNFIHGTSMVSMDLMRRLKYDDNLRGIGLEDWDFFLSAILNGEKAVYTPSTHLRYRRYQTIRSRSQRRRKNGRGLQAINYIYRKNIELFPDEMGYFKWLNTNIGENLQYTVRVIKNRDELLEEVERLKLQKDDLQEKVSSLDSTIRNIKNSKSYRLSEAIAFPVRKIKSYLK